MNTPKEKQTRSQLIWPEEKPKTKQNKKTQQKTDPSQETVCNISKVQGRISVLDISEW